LRAETDAAALWGAMAAVRPEAVAGQSSRALPERVRLAKRQTIETPPVQAREGRRRAEADAAALRAAVAAAGSAARGHEATAERLRGALLERVRAEEARAAKGAAALQRMRRTLSAHKGAHPHQISPTQGTQVSEHISANPQGWGLHQRKQAGLVCGASQCATCIYARMHAMTDTICASSNPVLAGKQVSRGDRRRGRWQPLRARCGRWKSWASTRRSSRLSRHAAPIPYPVSKTDMLLAIHVRASDVDVGSPPRWLWRGLVVRRNRNRGHRAQWPASGAIPFCE